MLLAVIISYAEKIVNRKAVPFGAAFSLRFSPPSLSEAKKPGHRFPIPLFCRSFGGEEKKRRCVQIPIPLPARLPPAPISVARHKEKPFPLPLPRLWRPFSGAAAYSFYKPLFCPILYYIDITVPKMSWLAVPILSPCRSLFVTSKLPF